MDEYQCCRVIPNGWKRKIEVGYDGDVILVDMQTKHTVRDENAWSRVGWNPFRGMELTGWPVLTVVERSARFPKE